MFGKIQITGILEVKTGMHIGTSDAFAAIGAIDSPVIRDAATKLPIIPGSSLKGKLRTLLAKQYNPVSLEIRTPDDDVQEIVNLFGRKADREKKAKTSRLIFSDMI